MIPSCEGYKTSEMEELRDEVIRRQSGLKPSHEQEKTSL